MRTIYVVLLISITVFAAILASDGSVASAQTMTVQTVCPVMEGTPIDRSLHTEYQGERVYFCCKLCKQTFSNDPEKYVSKLPQFSETTDTEAQGHGGHAHGGEHSAGKINSDGGIHLYSLIKPLGIATYSSLVITVLLGLFRRKLRRKFLIVHNFFAFLTLALATAHAALILILH